MEGETHRSTGHLSRSNVPANRSRTGNWRRSLEQIHERNGALEISLPRFFADGDASGGSDEDRRGSSLIWRVRILELSETEIVVEEPSALGQSIEIDDGLEVVCVIAMGQNRWMFQTVNNGAVEVSLAGGRKRVRGLRLEMPTAVERCQRRSFYRVSTVGLVLPTVHMWPVLDPQTVPAAEAAARERDRIARRDDIAGRIDNANPLALPEVGPPFTATLMNIGGGGAGLLVEPDDSKSLDCQPLFWLHIDLDETEEAAPVGVAARLVHRHRDSEQRIYAGMAFDLQHDAQHRDFVVERIVQYVAEMQRQQLKRRAELRSSA